MTGKARHWVPGDLLGGLVRRHGDLAIYLLPAGWWHGLRSTPLELTYGLERIATYIQGVDSIFDLDWDGVPKEEGGKTYADIFQQAEREFSAWNFEIADTAALFQHFRMRKQNASVFSPMSVRCRCRPMTSA